MDETDEQDSSSSDDQQLRIAETPKKKRKRKPKLYDEMDKLNKTIKKTMNKCENLTSDAAKKVLCKLVKNDHVLALALLKAEEDEKLEKEDNSSDDDEGNEKKSESDDLPPKLTRLKAKQLNQQLPLPGISLTTPEPDEEVVKLIQFEDLKSDEEDDEEYQPDYESDGDITNTTFSDIDSQPSTPGSGLVNQDDSPQKDGEFKIPKAPLTTVSKNFLFISRLNYYILKFKGRTREHCEANEIKVLSSNNGN